MTTPLKFLVYGLICATLVAGCSSTPSRYKLKHDKAPTGSFDFSNVPDAVPKWEPLSPGGNKSPYRVRGKTYHLMSSAEGFTQEGIASWYGVKFHGELTSNGETYNMYEMSAAHKTLPLPAYVRVTNLRNNRSVIVRVNDRGPFHEGRIIDLSYAAANRLDVVKHGTAPVRIEAITPPPPGGSSSVESSGQGADLGRTQLAYFVQIAAFSKRQSIEALKTRLERALPSKQFFVGEDEKNGTPLYRLRMGPYQDKSRAETDASAVSATGLASPLVIRRSHLAKQS